MKRAFMLRKRVRKAEKYYFKPRRDEFNEIEENETTFDPTMPSSSHIWGTSVVSSTKNCVEEIFDSSELIENEEYQHPESPDYDDKTLVPVKISRWKLYEEF